MSSLEREELGLEACDGHDIDNTDLDGLGSNTLIGEIVGVVCSMSRPGHCEDNAVAELVADRVEHFELGVCGGGPFRR